MSALAIIFAIIPITLMLVLSYFVLLSSEKAASEKLKKFAKVVAILLWVASGVVLVGATVRSVCGPRMCHAGPGMMMHGGMKGCPMMMHGGMKGCGSMGHGMMAPGAAPACDKPCCRAGTNK